MSPVYTLMGVLFALAAVSSAVSVLFTRERTSQLMGLAFLAMFLAAAVACLLLKMGWY